MAGKKKRTDHDAVIGKLVWRAYLRNMFYVVLVLSIWTWWARGFYVALGAGSVLYVFFVLVGLVAGKMDHFKK